MFEAKMWYNLQVWYRNSHFPCKFFFLKFVNEVQKIYARKKFCFWSMCYWQHFTKFSQC